MRRTDIKKVCLVMTSCITPLTNSTHLAIKNTDLRRKQYLDAIKFYINCTKIVNIIFCDSSEEKMPEEIQLIAEEVNKKVEWLSFNGNTEKVLEKGKGYGEGKILQYVIKKSSILKSCEYIFKVTGRLKILNINYILRVLRYGNNYFNSYDDKGKSFVDTRFFVVKISDYQNKLYTAHQNVMDNSGIYYEHCIAEEIINNSLNYHVFPIALNIEGYSGSTGLKYYTHSKDIFIKTIGLYFRYLFRVENKKASIDLLRDEAIYDDKIWNEKLYMFNNKRIVIYGAGVQGKCFYRLSKKHCKVVLWIDKNYKKLKKLYGKRIHSPLSLKNSQFDYILITINEYNDFQEIKERLIFEGMKEETILWIKTFI